jgi:hypothetical protein
MQVSKMEKNIQVQCDFVTAGFNACTCEYVVGHVILFKQLCQ